MLPEQRILAWEGCRNVRDLGGLHTIDGHLTRYGEILRGDTPRRLTAAGWSALHAYGVRTVITLRTHGMPEEELNFTSPYSDISIVQAAIEDITDVEFVQQWADSGLWCTPLYYQDALRRWPEQHAAVISAMARAQPGGILFHCKRGSDRTGIVALLLLTLVRVTPEDIIADYARSTDPDRDEVLAREHSSVQEALSGALKGLEIESYLCTAGASPVELAAVRERLLGQVR